MILGLIAAVGTLLCWSFGTFAFWFASRIVPPALLNRSRLLLAAVGTGILTIVVLAISDPSSFLYSPIRVLTTPTLRQWFWLGLSGVVGLTIGDLLGFSGLRILGARRQSILGTVAPAAAAISAFFFLDERLSWVGIVGMTISVGGVMWAMANAEERDDVDREGYGSYTTGIILSLGGAVCQGLGLALATIGMTSGDDVLHAGPELHPVHATFMRMSVGFLLTYVVDFLRRDTIRPLREAFVDPKATRWIITATFLGPITGVSLSLYAATQIGVGVAQTIFSMIPFVIMAFAALRQHERLHWQSVVGAIIAVGGVVVLIVAR
jgi:drug/metabolite transporter (DMT)-like permease